MNPLPLVRLHLSARTEAPLKLPPYAGSMLRGAFGHALLALSPLPHQGVQACRLAHACPYCQIFLSPALVSHPLQRFSHMPQPFVIEPPEGDVQLEPGDCFRFSVVLIGQALKFLPVAILAFQRALRHGLGPDKSPCRLVSVHQEGSPVPLWHEKNPLNPEQIQLQGSAIPPCLLLTRSRLDIQLLTPLRLQQKSQPVQSGSFTARLFLVALARRLQLLSDVHLGENAPQQDFTALSAQAHDIDIPEHNLRWYDWGRFSRRQEREMRLGGLVGRFQLRGELLPFSQLLHIGQWMHVGKNTSFGLGGYRIAHRAQPAHPHVKEISQHDHPDQLSR